MSAPIQIPTGQRFGSLTVLGVSAERIQGGLAFQCQCDCGRTTVVRSVYLRHGHTRSCGCRRSEGNGGPEPTHGMSKTPEFHAWQSIKDRCLNSRSKSFHNYGRRGIRVCARWRDSFEAFLADVGHRPCATRSIDRVDNEGHYEPGNVRWATAKQQSDNRRSVTPITYRGETLPLNDWAKRLGISQGTLRRRILELGWPIEKAMTKPTSEYHHR